MQEFHFRLVEMIDTRPIRPVAQTRKRLIEVKLKYDFRTYTKGLEIVELPDISFSHFATHEQTYSYILYYS